MIFVNIENKSLGLGAQLKEANFSHFPCRLVFFSFFFFAGERFFIYVAKWFDQ